MADAHKYRLFKLAQMLCFPKFTDPSGSIYSKAGYLLFMQGYHRRKFERKPCMKSRGKHKLIWL
jgi:hypothetical protein